MAGLFQWHQPQTRLFVFGIEIEPIGVLSFGNDHWLRRLEFLPGDGGRRDFVDRMFLDIPGPARIALVDTRTTVGCTPQEVQELVVVELDYFGSSHCRYTCLVNRANYRNRLNLSSS